MSGKNVTSSQLELLRTGYRPTDSEATSWNAARYLDPIRSQIVDDDLEWILPAIEDSRDVRAAFFIALLKPLATKRPVSNSSYNLRSATHTCDHNCCGDSRTILTTALYAR